MPKRRSKATFANAGKLAISDRGPQNPRLGNRAPGTNPPPKGGSGLMGGADEADFLRQEVHPGKQLNGEVNGSITPGRIRLSVQMRFNPIARLNPERLVGYLDQWRLGYFRMAGMAWDAMERRDYQIQIVAPKRKKSVARNGWEILTVENLPEAQRPLASDQADFLKNFWNNISVTTALEPDEQGGFALLVRQMMDAVGKRYAVHEIVWQPKADGSLAAKFIFCPIWWFEGTHGKLRFLDNEFQVFGNDMAPAEWLVTVHDGIMEACSVVFILKHLPLKSWVGFLDKFGTPGIHGKTEATYGSKEWNDFVEAMKNFAEDWSAVTNKSAEISLIEAKNSGGGENPFKAIVEYMDKAITILWRGSDLGTHSAQHGTGASLQQDETSILEQDDAQLLGETLTNQVSRYALEWKFGMDAPKLAYLKIKTTKRKDTAQDLATDTALVAMGFPVTQASAAERYERQLPDGSDGDALLTAPAGAATQAANPQQEEKEAQLANEGPTGQFETAAAKELTAALAPTLGEINKRLARIGALEDPVLQRQALASLLAWIEKNEAHFIADPDLQETVNNLLSAALANGLAAKPKS